MVECYSALGFKFVDYMQEARAMVAST